MPVLDDDNLRLGADTQVGTYIGGDATQPAEEETPTPPTPPDFAIEPNHLWWAPGYAGTGPFLDTGTTGGIDLDTTGSSFAGMVITPGQQTGLSNPSVSPEFGMGDFTILWVGAGSSEGFIFGNQWNYAEGFSDMYANWYLEMDSGPDVGLQQDGDDVVHIASDDESVMLSETVALSFTRSGDVFRLLVGGSVWTETFTGYGPLTGDAWYLSLPTSGAAVWLGIALTDEQIAQAATELGYVA